MKCEFCKKEIDIELKTIPPSWYASFQADGKIVKVACPDCLKISKNIDNWRK